MPRKPFCAEDCKMFEKHHAKGSKSKFHTTEFSFNQGYDTIYAVNFDKMTQKNMATNKVRNIRRTSVQKATWEWLNDYGAWSVFHEKDSALLDQAFGGGVNFFETKKLTFNKGYSCLCTFNFDLMTQTNHNSNTTRSIRRRL